MDFALYWLKPSYQRNWRTLLRSPLKFLAVHQELGVEDCRWITPVCYVLEGAPKGHFGFSGSQFFQSTIFLYIFVLWVLLGWNRGFLVPCLWACWFKIALAAPSRCPIAVAFPAFVLRGRKGRDSWRRIGPASLRSAFLTWADLRLLSLSPKVLNRLWNNCQSDGLLRHSSMQASRLWFTYETSNHSYESDGLLHRSSNEMAGCFLLAPMIGQSDPLSRSYSARTRLPTAANVAVLEPATAFQRWWRYWRLPGVVNRQRIYRGVFASELGPKGRDSERCCCCCAWRVWMIGRAPHLAQSKYIGVFALKLGLNGSDFEWCCCCSHWPPQRYPFTMRAGTGGVSWGCSKLLKRLPIYVGIPKVLALHPVTLYIQNFTGQQEHCDCWYSVRKSKISANVRVRREYHGLVAYLSRKLDSRERSANVEGT